MITTDLAPHLQKLVDLGESGTDILTEEAMDSMERKYWEGQMDALSWVYALTYQLSFAISDRTKKNG